MSSTHGTYPNLSPNVLGARSRARVQMRNGIGLVPIPRVMDTGHPGDRKRRIIPTMGLLDIVMFRISFEAPTFSEDNDVRSRMFPA